MAFTKTELQLLAEAERTSSKTFGVDHGVQGPSGRKRQFGVRRSNAVASLLKKGLIVRVHADSGTPLFTPGQGQTGVVYSSVYQVVSKG